MSEPERNVALLLAYDGRPFHGWQRHPGKPTVQGAVEEALSTATGAPAVVEGSGRTDRGVHAEGQVATARVPARIELDALREALARALPPAITLRDLRDVAPDVHARTSAVGKTYRYEIFQGGAPPPELELRVWHARRPLDAAPMAAAARHLVGVHDFATFATPTGFERGSTVRTMVQARVHAEGPRITLHFEADGFLYKMVRSLVGTLAKVGEGRLDPGRLPALLAARDRAAAPGAAPASGLYLEAVHYDPPLFPAP